VVVSCVGCDQVTKVAAGANLHDGSTMSLLGGIVQLTYSENAGGFLSIGARLPAPVRMLVFGGLSALFVVTLLVVAIRRRSLGSAKLLGIALIAGGGIGNLLDRATFGLVRDFLIVGVGGVHTGIFNVADMAVLGGVLLLFLASMRKSTALPLDPQNAT
jgi:signal peptidase II